MIRKNDGRGKGSTEKTGGMNKNRVGGREGAKGGE